MAASHWSTDTFSVQERFALGALLLAMAYCAAFITACQSLGVPWVAIVFAVGLAVFVAAAQVALRRWRRPRTASIVAGGVYTAAWWMWVLLREMHGRPDPLLLTLAPMFMTGGMLGYFAGAVDASVFLIHDWIRDTLRAKRTEREALRAAMGEKPKESPWDD